MMSCRKCSTNIPEGLHVCTQCGFEAQSPEDTLVLGGDEMGEPQESLLDVVRRELARDYEVHGELARGGMAVVFRATETELTRQVALKVLPPEMSLSQSMANRFRREARMAASLEHPNIIPIYRVGQAGRLFFITMKYIEGRPLSSMIESQGALPAPVVWHVLRGCASALAHAHEHGIIHRDIKGANILIDIEGRIVVSDFGVARALEDASMTASGSVIGTPYFMSPEQCAGKKVGAQTDQYSLGVLGFQMLAGHIPYDAETIAAVMHHHFFTPIPPLGSVRPDAPQAMIDIVNRALAKNPKQRYGTTQEMVEAIEAIPISDADRRWGEAMLREMAAGVPIPRETAGELPPLPDAMNLSGPVSTQQPIFTPSNAVMTPAPGSEEGTPAVAAKGGLRRRVLIAAASAVVAVATSAALWIGGAAQADPPAVDSLPGESAGAPMMAQAERASPAVTPPPTPDPVRGWVRVRTSTSDATVTVGGTRIVGGIGALAPGNYSWRASARGYFPDSGTVSVSDGDTVTLNPTLIEQPREPLATGKIRISASPVTADIFIDDQQVGQGRLVDHELTVGSHRLRVSAPGYVTKDSTFTLVKGETLPPILIKLSEAGSPP